MLLYLIEGVYTDWTSGCAIVAAKSEKEAWNTLKAKDKDGLLEYPGPKKEAKFTVIGTSTIPIWEGAQVIYKLYGGS